MQFVMQKERKDMTWTNCKVPYETVLRGRSFSSPESCILTVPAIEACIRSGAYRHFPMIGFSFVSVRKERLSSGPHCH